MATKDIGVGFIKAMVMARLEYIHTGVISPRLAAAAEPDLPSLVHKRVLEDYAARGEDPSLWLSPEGVEAHLGIKGGKMALAQLERAARGEEEPGLCEFLRQAMCRLSDMPVCFGDGPRWHVDVVDDVFADWALYIG
jgi:hypothetical protein